jgi:hypothetical protein
MALRNDEHEIRHEQAFELHARCPRRVEADAKIEVAALDRRFDVELPEAINPDPDPRLRSSEVRDHPGDKQMIENLHNPHRDLPPAQVVDLGDRWYRVVKHPHGPRGMIAEHTARLRQPDPPA